MAKVKVTLDISTLPRVEKEIAMAQGCVVANIDTNIICNHTLRRK